MHRNTRGFPLLMAVCGLLLLPAALCHQLGGMEFRTALFVREILDRGPLFIPHLHGLPYFDYPPLYFLLAASCAKLTGSTSPFTLILPSILAAMGFLIFCQFCLPSIYAREDARPFVEACERLAKGRPVVLFDIPLTVTA
jgi:hypothetical protein